MCYSAQIEAAYQKLVRMTGATVSLQEFAALYARDPDRRSGLAHAHRGSRLLLSVILLGDLLCL
ncbi:hypothetical protein SAMN05518671_2621 [Stenotrophomonas lactitubi]|nr:hypothetical protein SAMN05518671_2621 [Stenotrophomonas lactitubi]